MVGIICQTATSYMPPPDLCSHAMKSYINSLTPASPEVTPTKPEETPETHEGTSVYLSFEGMPSAAILNSLKSYSVSAAFYLSPEDIASNPDMVRRIAGSGHSVGILCSYDFDSDFNYGSELLFDAAQTRTVMISSSADSLSSCLAFAQQKSLVCYQYNLDGADRSGFGIGASSVTASLSAAGDIVRLRFDCSENTERILSTVLNYLYTNKFDLRIEREV